METFVIVAAVLAGLFLLRYLTRSPVKVGKVASATFREIGSLAELDSVFDASHKSTQLLYLHDPW